MTAPTDRIIVLEAFEHVHPDRCTDYEAASQAIDDLARETEPGMLVHALTVHARADDRVTYRWLEVFTDAAALEAHFASLHVQAHGAKLNDGILLSPVEILLYVDWSEAEKVEINTRLGGALKFAEVRSGFYRPE
ncbi:quinol monooxygenase YgiN [Palleronia aestuarii]|uniref:Quinol monooxygenase YgiN n=1 Tax=Palleronia aestuarii TaxID=568105 RepID=A0A2W7MVK5_9RHOB|nr:antibiotic biosynthesis monooxygenase [Palleronia aestuarii]PZX12185.1 quinol monooxygenase YgiN [Palleronia aestuarii]